MATWGAEPRAADGRAASAAGPRANDAAAGRDAPRAGDARRAEQPATTAPLGVASYTEVEASSPTDRRASQAEAAPGRGPVLVLGGTSEGRRVAGLLVDAGVPVVSSLAGRVGAPRLPPGEVRIGGFGGVDGLIAWLTRHEVRAVVDTTHPYAAQMTAHAAAACAQTCVPIVRLQRPEWTPVSGDDWRLVDSLPEASRLADALGDRVFVTTGRGEVAAFADMRAWCLLRSVDPPEPPLPQRHRILCRRGPFDLAQERATLQEWRIDVLVTKNSGGAATAAKLVAARERAIPVVMVRRPPLPAGLTCVDTPTAAADWALSGEV